MDESGLHIIVGGTMEEPFLLREKTRLPKEPAPSAAEFYDPQRQLWIDAASGLPVVHVLSSRFCGSNFGETTLTETREGVDQPEMVGLRASAFGETLLTKTSEGADRSEGASMLATSSCGVDGNNSDSGYRADSVRFLDEARDPSLEPVGTNFGETVYTATIEGVDKAEGTSDLNNASDYYF